MNYLSRIIHIWYWDRAWAEKVFEDIIDVSPPECILAVRKGKFERLWKGYSHTTMRHVNAYIEHYGITGGGKKWWYFLHPIRYDFSYWRKKHCG